MRSFVKSFVFLAIVGAFAVASLAVPKPKPFSAKGKHLKPSVASKHKPSKNKNKTTPGKHTNKANHVLKNHKKGK